MSLDTKLPLAIRLAERAAKRAAQYDTELVEVLPDFWTYASRAILGDFSHTLTTEKKRYLLARYALKPYGVWQSPSELARDFLAERYVLPLKIRKVQADAVKNPRPMPLYARIGYWGDCEYIDLRSAYWQIVRATGWDVEYKPNVYIGVSEPLLDVPTWLIDSKIARASLVSMGRPSSMTVWTGEKIILQKSTSPYINMRLVALVSDVLNAVAYELFSSVPVAYVNTDGYIVPYEYAQRAKEILQTWGLDYRVKAQGTTQVWGVGSYRVGDTITERRGQNIPYSNLATCDYAWMRKHFSAHVARYHRLAMAQSERENLD